MTPLPFLDELQAAAHDAETAEAAFRRNAAARIAALEQERAFAFRRVNFMRAVAEAVASAEDEDAAVAHASAALRARLGWSSDSEARSAVLARFAPVAEALFLAQPLEADRPTSPADVRAALASFEAWYAETHARPFWALFEHYVPETPLVDF
ncbi:MAG: hypothetical protein ACXW3G_10415 [Rhodoplanes sp.]